MTSDVKLRRCNIDWRERMPPVIAIEQEAKEKNATAWAMRQSGMKYREIGDFFGVTMTRARQRVLSHEALRRQGRKTPAERLYNETQILKSVYVGVAKARQIKRFLRDARDVEGASTI